MNLVWRGEDATRAPSDTNIRRYNLTVRRVKNKSRALKVIERFFVGNCHFRRSKSIVRIVVEMHSESTEKNVKKKKRSKRKIGDSKFICSTSWSKSNRLANSSRTPAQGTVQNMHGQTELPKNKNHFSTIFLPFTIPWLSFNTKHRTNRNYKKSKTKTRRKNKNAEAKERRQRRLLHYNL